MDRRTDGKTDRRKDGKTEQTDTQTDHKTDRWTRTEGQEEEEEEFCAVPKSSESQNKKALKQLRD